jgi:hypothetical protein
LTIVCFLKTTKFESLFNIFKLEELFCKSSNIPAIRDLTILASKRGSTYFVGHSFHRVIYRSQQRLETIQSGSFPSNITTFCLLFLVILFADKKQPAAVDTKQLLTKKMLLITP